MLGIGVIAALVIGWQVTAFAVHDTGAFELDGNAISDNAPAPVGPADDWDRVCHQVTKTLPAAQQECKTATDTTGATAVSWVAEPDTNTSIFTGGGSKDPIDLDQWAWKDGAGGLPDKDNLRHSFAARYDDTSDGDVLYFGSDRFDNSGDAQQGFWFFQDKVTLGNIKSGGGFNFNGLHQDGDLLIISDFSNGGTTSTITVYEWDHTVSGNLKQLATSTAANCKTPPGPTDDRFCGIVNPASGPGITNGITPSPWSFRDKSGNTGFANGEFYEGGVNLSALGLADECFSSALAETRSSTSTTATLKDFTLGQFSNCSATFETTASNTGTVTPGTSITDTATLTGQGTDNPPSPTGTVTFFLCGPSTTGVAPDCSSGGTPVGSAVNLTAGANSTSTATSSAVSPTGTGIYCFRAEYSGDSTYDPDSHTNTTTECFTVQDTSTVTTTQSWVPNDSAHVTLGSGGNATTGTVTFQLFESDDCTGTAVALDGLTDRPVNASGDAVTANTAAVPVDLDGTISWLATYNPPDGSGITESTGNCETSTVTITN